MSKPMVNEAQREKSRGNRRLRRSTAGPRGNGTQASGVPQPTRRERANHLPLAAGVAFFAGVTAAFVSTGRRGAPHEDQGHRELVAYLHDHLAGADAAIRVVERLREKQTDEQPLFAWLCGELRADRAVLRGLLTVLGASSQSPKGWMGQAAGGMLQYVSGGSAGDLSLFRTLEALSIGVQGKRCLWRALETLQPSLQLPGTRSAAELEAAAVRQWEAIERRRLALVQCTFGAASRE